MKLKFKFRFSIEGNTNVLTLFTKSSNSSVFWIQIIKSSINILFNKYLGSDLSKICLILIRTLIMHPLPSEKAWTVSSQANFAISKFLHKPYTKNLLQHLMTSSEIWLNSNKHDKVGEVLLIIVADSQVNSPIVLIS